MICKNIRHKFYNRSVHDECKFEHSIQLLTQLLNKPYIPVLMSLIQINGNSEFYTKYHQTPPPLDPLPPISYIYFIKWYHITFNKTGSGRGRSTAETDLMVSGWESSWGWAAAYMSLPPPCHRSPSRTCHCLALNFLVPHTNYLRRVQQICVYTVSVQTVYKPWLQTSFIII